MQRAPSGSPRNMRLQCSPKTCFRSTKPRHRLSSVLQSQKAIEDFVSSARQADGQQVFAMHHSDSSPEGLYRL